MKNKVTVTIGIPAYNEEQNIGILIKKLLKQKQEHYMLKEILIYLDGSTDNTKNIIKSFKNNVIRVKEGKKRIGQQEAQNILLRNYKSDYIVFAEADVLPKSANTIDELIIPFLNGANKNLGMVVGNESELSPKTFFESIASQGGYIKRQIANEWKNQDNIYNSGGHAMKALSKNFVKQLKWPKSVPEDSYTYLRLKELGLEMKKQMRATTSMRNVTHVKDSIKQSRKFVTGKKALEKYFGKDTIKKEFNFPKTLFLKHVILAGFKKPLFTFLFLFQIIINRTLTVGQNRFNELYAPYNSSKLLITK